MKRAISSADLRSRSGAAEFDCSVLSALREILQSVFKRAPFTGENPRFRSPRLDCVKEQIVFYLGARSEKRIEKRFTPSDAFQVAPTSAYIVSVKDESILIRILKEGDPPTIAAAFRNMGWSKPESQYRRYLQEQAAGTRTCFVATVGGKFAGYVTVNWQPIYAGFAELNIPEIQDLNVLRTYRRKGIASTLLDRAEAEVARRSRIVGIGVGLHPGYNAAQRLYVKRGYIPDGRGITYRDHFVDEGAQVRLDDDLVMHFTKQLGAK